MKKVFCSILVVFTILLAGCSVSGAENHAQPVYQSYREIPGVTQEEIDAVKALLIERPTLVYGFVITTEAFIREDGSVGGFASLLCQRMSQLIGFEFELLPCTWEYLVDKTKSMSIDLVGDLTATPQRQQQYFMTEAMIQRTLKVFTLKNAPSLEEIQQERSPVCAFLDGGTTYLQVADSWDLPFAPVFVSDESVVPDMLLRGEIDAFVEEGIIEASFDAYDFIQARDYYPLTYAPSSLATANPRLSPIISIMQKYLDNGGTYELAELYRQGSKEYAEHKLYAALTEEEKEYIRNHSSEETAVPVAFESDNYPASFYNSQEKAFQGVAVDVLDQVAELTGLQFQVGNQVGELWPQLLDGVERGKYAIVGELIQSPQRENRFLWTDTPHYTDYFAMISKADYPDADINHILVANVGLLEGTALTDVFRKWFPSGVNTTVYAGVEQAVAALERGEIDLLAAKQNLLLHITNYLEKPGFKTNIVFQYTTDSYLGFHKNEEILCSIVNKAQQFIDAESITEEWKQKAFDYERAMLKTMLPYIIGFLTLLVAALLVVCLLLFKNKKISRSLEEQVARRTDELALQTATLTTIFESIPDLIFCKDTSFRFTRCNKAFEDYFGRSEAEMIGQEDSYSLGMTEAEIEWFRAADRRVMEERQAVTVEERIPTTSGAPRLFETIKIPLIQNGVVVGLIGISRDVTQRKTAEETLRLILDNMDACVYITEVETDKILFINDRMLREYDGIDCVGKECWSVLQKDFTGRCEFCPVPKLQAGDEKECVWEEHSTVTGKYYKNTDSIIQWHDGRDVHMQHSVDITDLIRLQKDLESASKAKSDFLSRMSHEIRTPLNAIIGMINIALGSTTNEKTKSCLVKADSASKHLLGLINDILDMSKIEADKYELDCREFSFEKMLINVANVTSFRAEEKKLNFIVNLGGNVPDTIVGDDLRLSQVITNLLTNAVKFTPEGGTVKLNIHKTANTEDDVELYFSVEDTGIGISEEQQKRLFHSFEQADGSISRRFGGTGLGLAISKRIVELMDGKIWIESELGHGSKFIFTIRVKKGKGYTGTKLSQKIDREALRILAVDDCAEIREYFAHVMESLNLPCDVASGGDEALDMIRSCGGKPYTIFFVDWQMPGMDGVELTRKIKDMTSDNAIVFMISVAEWGNIEKDALAAGVRSFISKPLFPSTLVNAINECVEMREIKPTVGSLEQAMNRGLSFEGHRILIAEDVEINREIMSAVLEESRLEIDYAENGQIAVDMFAGNPDRYSLVFMDIHMPEMDGYEASRQIRGLKLPWAKEVPIVAMTANVFREDVENCLAAGMNAHIGKPVDPDALFDTLRQYLGK